jgi:hypothetical protein
MQVWTHILCYHRHHKWEHVTHLLRKSRPYAPTKTWHAQIMSRVHREGSHLLVKLHTHVIAMAAFALRTAQTNMHGCHHICICTCITYMYVYMYMYMFYVYVYVLCICICICREVVAMAAFAFSTAQTHAWVSSYMMTSKIRTNTQANAHILLYSAFIV